MAGCFCTGACQGDPSQCPANNPGKYIRSSFEEILSDPEKEKERWIKAWDNYKKTVETPKPSTPPRF